MTAAPSSHPEAARVRSEHLDHPRTRAAFRGARLLVGGYLALSVLTLGAVVLLRDDSAAVNSAVWVRASIVVLSAVVTHLCVTRAAAGSRSAYRRLRILSGVMVVAIAAIIALPGAFPLWLKTEQAVCGVLLLAVVALVNGKHLRSLFAGE
ncbi:hypothetical protein ABR738_05720 [Streptomyces sp. Edi4]|uniref:hypothetical protein n=1 Tax=Streptomyces sp. Edi4 TaxID=3162527 RepID=UPI00330593D5